MGNENTKTIPPKSTVARNAQAPSLDNPVSDKKAGGTRGDTYHRYDWDPFGLYGEDSHRILDM